MERLKDSTWWCLAGFIALGIGILIMVEILVWLDWQSERKVAKR
jgi:hypothetical protein